MNANPTTEHERASLGFARAVRERFALLEALGFELTESCSTLVCYKKGELAVAIYHGRQSYEIGFEIAWQGERYTIYDLIRFAEAEETASGYRSYMTSTPQGVKEGLEILAEMVHHYGARALGGDPFLFATLDAKRKVWREEFALDMAVRRLRPTAEAAFRRGDYKEAARIYEEISSRLTPAELKKRAFAKKRCGG